MNILSLFDGMSCGQIALQNLDFRYENYFASETEPSAIKVTQHNFPGTIQLGDVTKIIPRGLPYIDLLMGGSPCQGFSMLGKQKNFDDPRSKLFFEFVKLKNELRPKYFLLENVRMKREYLDIISRQLEVEPIRINSALVSAARRDRYYWTNIPNVTIPQDRHITFDDINSNSQDWIPLDKIEKIKKWKAQQKPLENATLIGAKQKLPCLTARGYNQYHSGMILITDGINYRYLTNEEAERAHNVPVGYTSICNDKERSHMIGNGWTINVISHIFEKYRISMKKIKLSELLMKLYNSEYLSDYEYEIYIRLVQSFQKEAQEEEAISKYF